MPCGYNSSKNCPNNETNNWPLCLPRLPSEEPEYRQAPTTEMNHLDVSYETVKDLNEDDKRSAHLPDEIKGLKMGCLGASAKSLELSTGMVPCWAARLPFVHPLHQLIQRGCIGIESQLSKLTTFTQKRNILTGGNRKRKVESQEESDWQQSALDPCRSDFKLRWLQCSSNSSLVERRGSGGNRVTSSDSMSISKTLFMARKGRQERNTRKPNMGIDPGKAVIVEKLTLERRRPSIQKPVQQLCR